MLNSLFFFVITFLHSCSPCTLVCHFGGLSVGLNEKIVVIFVSSDLHFSVDWIEAYCFVMNPACLRICILFCQVIVKNLQLSRLSEFVNFVGLSWSGMGWVVCVLLA